MSQELQKWADGFMFEAEPSLASDGPKAYLLGGPVDPLGQIAACAKMYKGEVVRDLADVTDDERREYLRELQKTALKMPLEAVSLHFMLEGVHRGITHQLVRQRTGAYAQESTRFAVKRDMREATALPPSLMDTLPLETMINNEISERRANGLHYFEGERDWIADAIKNSSRLPEAQRRRFRWDDMVNAVSDGYNWLIDDGMPAEEARGIMPTNITTRLNYITNLRSFYDTMAVRVSDQAQFEWRQVAGAYALAMQAYGRANEYETWVKFEDPEELDKMVVVAINWEDKTARVRSSSAWQYDALVAEIKPIEFKIGKRAFGANFDRPSRIAERVDAFAQMGVPSDRWIEGAPEFCIPGIDPAEWLLDPNSARLDGTQEFDIFGNRVPKGEGWHWISEGKGVLEKVEEGRYWRGIWDRQEGLTVTYDSLEAERDL